jgi:hypothetical protein
LNALYIFGCRSRQKENQSLLALRRRCRTRPAAASGNGLASTTRIGKLLRANQGRSEDGMTTTWP